MKKDLIYQILIVLMIGLFTINFIIFRMKNEFLTITTSLTIIVSGIMKLKDDYQRNKINKTNVE
jgi:hypothetical protein